VVAMTTLRHVTLKSTQTFHLKSTQTFPHPLAFPPAKTPPPYILETTPVNMRNGKRGIYVDEKAAVCLGVYWGVQEEVGGGSDVQGDSDRVQGEVMWWHVQVGE
jgi:hypothetical protein